MAIDRFVRWLVERPTMSLLRMTLEDYLGNALFDLHIDGKRITARLIGKPSFPFRRHVGYKKMTAASEQREERFFEVYVEKDHIDVITRQTDEFTNVVAAGFAELCRRRWQGKAGEPT